MNSTFQAKEAVWRMAGGDATRGGLLGAVVRLMARSPRGLAAAGAVQASVVFDTEGWAFVADLAGAVQAYTEAGDLRWRVQLTGGISATPAVDTAASRLFVGTHAGHAYALDTGTGGIVWHQEIPTESDPRILSDLLHLRRAGLVVLSSWGGRFRALDAASGVERFSWDAGISPAAAVSADRDETLYCLRAVSERGTELVEVSTSGTERVLHRVAEGQRGARRMLTAAAPVVDPGRGMVYAVVNPDHGGLLVAWSVRTQAVTWTCALPNAVQATPALDHSGRLFLPDLAGAVQRVSPEGELQAGFRLGCEYLLAGGVGDGEGRFYVGDPWGRVHVIEDGAEPRVLFEAGRAIQGRPSFGPDRSLHVPGTDRRVYVFPAARAAA